MKESLEESVLSRAKVATSSASPPSEINVIVATYIASEVLVIFVSELDCHFVHRTK